MSVMVTTFSSLEPHLKEEIARQTSADLLAKINRTLKADEIVSIFDQYDIDIEIGKDLSFSLQHNTKLKMAVQCISKYF